MSRTPSVKGIAATVLLLFAALLAGASGPVQAAPGDAGRSFPITSSGRAPHLARAADGSIVVTYLVNLNDGQGTVDVMAQRLDASGVAVGAPFRVNTAAAQQRERARVAVAPDGRFVVIWRQTFAAAPGGGSVYEVLARRYNAAGQSQGQPFRVHAQEATGGSETSSLHSFGSAEVGMDANANFITTWRHQLGQGDGPGGSSRASIEGRRWAADGTAQGAEFQVVIEGFWGALSNRKSSGSLPNRLAVRGNGEFAVLYSTAFEQTPPQTPGTLLLRRYNADATPKAEAQPVTASAINLFGHLGRLALAMHPSSGYAVVWDQSLGNGNTGVVLGQRLGEDGNPQSASFQPFTAAGGNEESLDAGLDAAGNLTVLGRSVSGADIVAYHGRPDGSSFGRAFRLIKAPAVGAQTFQVAHTGLAMNANGDALTVYTEAGTSDVRGRFFSLPAAPVAPVALAEPKRVNTYLAGTQDQPAVSVDAANEKLFGWASSQRDSNPQYAANGGIYAQLFRIDGNPQSTGELRQNVLTPGVEAEPDVLVLRPQFFQDDRFNAQDRFTVMSAWRKLEEDDEGPGGVLARLNLASFSIADPQLSTDVASGSPALAYSPTLSDTGVYPGDQVKVAIAWREGAASGGSVRLRYVLGNSRTLPPAPVDRTVAAAAGSAVPTTVDLAMASLGEAVVVWSGRQAGDSSDQIYAQRFGRDMNAVGDPIRVSAPGAVAQRLPKVEMDSVGGFVVAWTTGTRVAVRRFAADGSARGDATLLGQSPPAGVAPGIAVDFDGDHAVAWLEGDSDVVFQAFRRDGEPLGGVNSALAGSGLAGPFSGVGIDSSDEGDFTLVWSGDEIYSRSYSVTGDNALLPLLRQDSPSTVSITPNNVNPGTVVTLRPSFNCSGAVAQTLQRLRVPAPVAIRKITDSSRGSFGAGFFDGNAWACTLDSAGAVSCTGSCGSTAVEVTAPSQPGQYLIEVDHEATNAGRSEASEVLVVNGPVNGTLSFRSDRGTATEADGTLNLLVSRSGGFEGAVTVAYNTSDLSARAGSDYTATSGTLSWAANDSADKAISIPITADAEVEGEETFRVELLNATGGAVAGHPNEMTVTLRDAQVPGSLAFSMTDYSVSESVGMATITVNRVGGASGAAQVFYDSNGGSATANQDYTPPDGRLDWADGDTAAKTFTVAISNDALVEVDETVALRLYDASGASLGSPASATLTIVSDDQSPGSIRFSTSGLMGPENQGAASIVVQRSGGASGAASVQYSTADGTANAGSDYVAASGTLNWADGDMEPKSFSFDIVNDNVSETDETVALSLSNATGAMLGSPATASFTITNDDQSPGTLAYEMPAYGVQESLGMLVLRVRRSGGSGGAASVRYATADGTATAGADYLAASGTLNWVAGDASDKTFSLAITSDSEDEPNETVQLSLSDATGATLGSPSTSTLTLFDDDEPAADTTPDAFGFTDQTGVAPSSVVLSDTITVAGINAAAAISVSGGEYRIGTGSFTSAAGTVGNGQSVQLRHTAAAGFGASVNTTLVIGGVSDTFTSTTAATADTTPDAYSFRDQTGVPASTVITSNAVQIRGINSAAAISVTGGSYRIDGGAFVTAAGTVREGQLVQVQHTSSQLANQAVNTTLTVGTVSDTFTSTTGFLVQADATPNGFDFTDAGGVVTDSLVESDLVTIGGINVSTAISVSGGEYSVDGGPYVSYASTILNGQTVRLRHRSAAAFAASTTTTLTVGGVSGSFVSTTATADTTPDDFSFLDRLAPVDPLAVVVSDPVVIGGLDAAAAISVVGGEYAIGCQPPFVTEAGTLAPGQSVCVRHTASSVFGSLNQTTLTIGGVADTFSSRTRDGDGVPDAFQFADQTGVAVNSLVVSSVVTVRGLELAATVTVSGGEYAIGCVAPFQTEPGSITEGQTVCVRHTAASAANTAVNTVLGIGGVSDTFTSITAGSGSGSSGGGSGSGGSGSGSGGSGSGSGSGSGGSGSGSGSGGSGSGSGGSGSGSGSGSGGGSGGGGSSDTTPDPFQWQDQSDVAIDTLVVSAPIAVTGIDAEASISVSGGEYSLGCAAEGYTAVAGSVGNGVAVCVRHRSAATAGTGVSTVLTIGGVSDTFTSTTVAATGCSAALAPRFDDQAPPSVQVDAELRYTLRVRSPTGSPVTVTAPVLPSCISLLSDPADADLVTLAGLVDVGCIAGGLTAQLRALDARGCETTLPLSISALGADTRQLTDALGRLVRVVVNNGALRELRSVAVASLPTASLPGFRYDLPFIAARITDAASSGTAKLAAGGVAQLALALPPGATVDAFVSCTASVCSEVPGATVSGGVLTVRLLDGGAGDVDGRADGVITVAGGAVQRMAVVDPRFGDRGGALPLALLLPLLLLGLRRRRG